MKKIFLLCSIALLCSGAVAQDISAAQVPSAVSNALGTAYPKAEDLKWKLKNDLYHADFEIGKDDYDVWLDGTGKIVKRKYEIPTKQLPAAIQATLTKDYAGYTAHDAEKTESKGTSTYKVKLKKTGEERKLVFGEDGKVTNQKEE
jgi:hypothetical protein